MPGKEHLHLCRQTTVAGTCLLNHPGHEIVRLDGIADGLLKLSLQAVSLAQACQVKINQGLLIAGMITGIDGSGFAGLPLTGSLSGALAPTVGLEAATLAAIGQMGAVWTGGGTLVAWSSLIAVAGFARVPVFQIVQTVMVPVLIGLATSTVCAVLIWH